MELSAEAFAKGGDSVCMFREVMLPSPFRIIADIPGGSQSEKSSKFVINFTIKSHPAENFE
jgi:hypothetical protein